MTAFTQPIQGVPAGIGGNLALADWLPSDNSLVAASADPATVFSTGLLGSGNVYVTTVKVSAATTVSKILTFLAAASSAATAGQCFQGIYQGGALLGQSADLAALWNAAAANTLESVAIAGAPIAVASGLVQVVTLFNGTTSPMFASMTQQAALANAGLTVGTSRYGVAVTGRTTLPATLPAALVAQVSTNIWAALA